MNWGIYEKRKKTIIWAFVLNLIIVLIVVILPALGTTRCKDYAFLKDKSRLKQIGTTVAMYFTENIDSFPISPKALDIDSSIINNAIQDSWYSISYTSPYYFFPEEGSIYTGSSLKPLAVRKNPVKGYNKNHILFEDGHVEAISPKDTRNLIKIYTYFKMNNLYIAQKLKSIYIDQKFGK